MSSSIKWRAEPEGPPKPSASSTPAPETGDPTPTLVELLSFSSAPRPFKNPSFTRPMAKRNKTLKQIVTTEREAALGLITSGKRKGKRPVTAVEAAAVAAAGGVPAEPPFELTIRGPGGRKMRLVGAAARAAQARQLREQQMNEDAEGEGEEGGVAAAADADGQDEGANKDVVMQDAATADGAVADAAPSAAATGEPVTAETRTEPAEGNPAAAMPAGTATESKPRREVASYFSVDAPPSLRPRKHYCDITGLLGPYTDPKTRLRYHNAEIYSVIRRFGPGVDQQYLALRGDAHTIK